MLEKNGKKPDDGMRSIKILAVSGGVDSMAMLHIYRDDPSVVVAHFNHGTRPSADTDQAFVARIAKAYGRPFYSQTVKLGENASEEKARTARYDFLNQLADELNGKIYTAHHADDLIESIAINLLRGTGWRGLTPLSLHRHPFLTPDLFPGTVPGKRKNMLWHKVDILRYAAEHSIVFRLDPTNTSDHYLRNRLRQSLCVGAAPGYRKKILSLWQKQENLRQQIEQKVAHLLPTDNIYDRQLFRDLPDEVALEILRAGLAKTDISATRPQLTDFLSAIRTYPTNKKFNLPGDRLIQLEKTTFALQ